MPRSGGLEGVVAARTSISDIDGAKGKLLYAGYSIDELAEHSSFEETVYLLHHLELPTASELAELDATLRREQRVPDGVARVVDAIAPRSSAMTVLRTAVSLAASDDPDGDDQSPQASLRTAYRLVALTPQLVAAYHRVRAGADTFGVRDDLSLAGNLLYALTGKVPEASVARDVDVVMLLYADHTMNASTFAGRVAAATLADMYASVTAAIATLQGPLHGGAIEGSRRMLDEIGDPNRVEGYLKQRLAAKQKVMGFGHRVYRTMDPRAVVLRDMSQRLGQHAGDTRWFEISARIQEVMLAERGLYPNVDFFTASVYAALGIPIGLYTALFATARMAGWTAHIREQYADNRLIRPDSEYIGPPPRHYQPLDERG